jgi:NAD+ synthase (glutamine-hydrolysing)
MNTLKITIAQPHLRIADFDQTLLFLKESLQHAQNEGASFVVFPELFIGGYPPRDLWFEPGFWERVDHTLLQCCALSQDFTNITLVMGAPFRDATGTYNTAYLIENGQILFKQHKHLLPVYDVFDETRYFTPGPLATIIEHKGLRIGLLICEDAWAKEYPLRYKTDPIEHLTRLKPDLTFHLSASPFELHKPTVRNRVVCEAARRLGCPVVMVNQVGLHDDILFDGQSGIASAQGELVFSAPAFEKGIFTQDLSKPSLPRQMDEPLSLLEKGLCLGIRDYVYKSGFSKVVLGLSGGIDSALTAALAVHALGKENVTGMLMPSEFSSQGSLDDAHELAKTLGISTYTLGIQDLYHTFSSTLSQSDILATGLTLENLQSRIRGTLLMAYSNQTHALVLTTGNKSEMAVGYCTLYGDMNGALGVLGDLYKTQVYALAKWINRTQEIIPLNSILKPPSAELRPDQKDQDSLPEYALLDAILKGLIEDLTPAQTLIENGYPEKWVTWTQKALHRTEYKRQQAPPLIRVSGKAFGSGRRHPILWG